MISNLNSIGTSCVFRKKKHVRGCVSHLTRLLRVTFYQWNATPNSANLGHCSTSQSFAFVYVVQSSDPLNQPAERTEFWPNLAFVPIDYEESSIRWSLLLLLPQPKILLWVLETNPSIFPEKAKNIVQCTILQEEKTEKVDNSLTIILQKKNWRNFEILFNIYKVGRNDNDDVNFGSCRNGVWLILQDLWLKFFPKLFESCGCHDFSFTEKMLCKWQKMKMNKYFLEGLFLENNATNFNKVKNIG